jgi:hypothetical protein
MNQGLSLLGGIGLGAVLAYFLDPEAGPRRRALLRDRLIRVLKVIENGVETTVTDVTEITHGLEAEIRSWLAAEQGSEKVSPQRLKFLEENWSPAVRLLAGTVGCGLMTNCLASRTPLAILLGTAGFGLFVRSLTNTSLFRLLDQTQQGTKSAGESSPNGQSDRQEIGGTETPPAF